MDMDAVIYIRVSTEEQASGGTSLATQEASCRDWCQRNHANVVHVYRDAGETAKTANRPQFIAMVDWCRKHRPDYVVVWKFDRWARNSTDHAIYAAHLAKGGTRLVSATEGCEDNPAGRLLETILSGVAQFDNEVRAERVRHSMKAVAMSGGWCSVAPFGYKLSRSGRIPILVEHPDKAPAVVEMFKGIASGRRNVVQTIAYARDHGLQGSQVRQLLRSPVYAGFLKSPLTDNKEIPAAFMGIISRDLFDDVQAVLGTPQLNNRMQQRDEFVLNRIARCATCGKLLVSSWSTGHGGRYAYARCRTAGHLSMRLEKLQSGFMAMLIRDAQAFSPMLDRLHKHIGAVVSDRKDASTKVANGAHARIMRINDQMSKLASAWSEGLIPDNIFREKQQALMRQQKENEFQLYRKNNFYDDVDAACMKAMSLIRDPAGLWARMDGESRRRFVAILFQRGIIVDRAGNVEPAKGSGFTGLLSGFSADNSEVAYLAGIASNFISVVGRLLELAA